MEGGKPPARKVMVVADPTRESAGALQYALSHVVVEHDELILIHVENPNSWRNTFSTFLRRPSLSSNSAGMSSDGGGGGGCEVDFLEEMKNICQIAQPKIRLSVERVLMEGKDKPNLILDKSKSLGIDLLITGQRRSFSSAILGRRSRGSLRGTKAIDTAEYLIENSKCTCVGVQKKGQNAGYMTDLFFVEKMDASPGLGNF
ncbi:uncharacterized protein LOC120012647 [Tripterygium wilfordii]|uniref:uncharacterized protein LOC120012647 n=1 Tax=Tripterygium wilfordii TaxID=458696 RepID=UPI0018F83606|nr:uncharacterized protein LOC120012647 [Tripterygium wilfordii]